jgi:alpha-beta hydrolase superfamily lysophospholipase
MGVLHLPDSSRPPVVIGSHGLFGTSGSAKQVALAAACVANGIGFFRFDHRGCGHSTGDFDRVTTLAGRVQDMLAATEIAIGRADTAQTFGFFGSSFGGTVCIEAAGLQKPAAVVLCAAPVRSGDIDPARAVPADDSAAEHPRPANLQFDVTGNMDGLQDVLLFHGDADEVVPYRHAGEIYAAGADPKKRVTLPGGDHRMTDPSHQKLFVAETIRWFKDRLLAPGRI